jgi:predicted dinucleotide-binding enzyme
MSTISTISIIGTGSMASALAGRALAGGNEVEIISAEGRPLDVFIAGDDAQAKEGVWALVESLGMRPLDTGPLSTARALEHATLLHVGLVAHSVKHTNFFLSVNILS